MVALLGLFAVAGCGGSDEPASGDASTDTGAGASTEQPTSADAASPDAVSEAADSSAPSGGDTAAGDAATDDAAAAAAASSGAAAATGSGTGVLTLDDEQIALANVLCFFQEQPRAGLGGVFTHTAQARGTNAAGVEVVVDLSRARAEDGTEQDVVIVDIGDPFSEDLVSLATAGPGLLAFTDNAVSAFNVSAADFGTDPVNVSFEMACS